ncbi:MAG: glycosyltransferase family 4 protein [bacterium]
MKDKKLFVTIHHLIFDEQYQKYTSFFQKIFHYLWIKPNLKKTLKVADKVVAVSNFTAKSVKKYFNLKRTINTIYNGIDTDIFKFES